MDQMKPITHDYAKLSIVADDIAKLIPGVSATDAIGWYSRAQWVGSGAVEHSKAIFVQGTSEPTYELKEAKKMVSRLKKQTFKSSVRLAMLREFSKHIYIQERAEAPTVVDDCVAFYESNIAPTIFEDFPEVVRRDESRVFLSTASRQGVAMAKALAVRLLDFVACGIISLADLDLEGLLNVPPLEFAISKATPGSQHLTGASLQSHGGQLAILPWSLGASMSL